MRIFVTGASGWVGTAVIPELIEAGHEVVGLARSDQAAATVAAVGGKVHRGSLEDLDSLREAAKASDGVIHLGFVHDFSQYEAAVRTDVAAIETFGDVLAGSDRPLVIASGAFASSSGAPATERDTPAATSPREAAASLTIALAERGVRSSVVRLPPSVHGRGDAGFIRWLVDIARAKGVSGHVGDGANRWPAVHRLDAAPLFRLAVESAAGGASLHAVADEGVPTRTIAELIGRHLGLAVESIPAEQAMEHFGFLGLVFAADLPMSSQITRELLGWAPTHIGLLEDIEEGHYFVGD